MSNVIQFLESLGSNQALSSADYAASVAALDVNDAQRQALICRDHRGLSDLHEGRATMRCLIMTPQGCDL